MTGAAYVFMGVVWVAIIGTAVLSMKKIVSSK